MSIWSSLMCPSCRGEGELTLATCGGWLRLSCSNKKCHKCWIVILPDKDAKEIYRQLRIKVTRTEFESDMGKGIEKLSQKRKELKT